MAGRRRKVVSGIHVRDELVRPLRKASKHANDWFPASCPSNGHRHGYLDPQRTLINWISPQTYVVNSLVLKGSLRVQVALNQKDTLQGMRFRRPWSCRAFWARHRGRTERLRTIWLRPGECDKQTTWIFQIMEIARKIRKHGNIRESGKKKKQRSNPETENPGFHWLKFGLFNGNP